VGQGKGRTLNERHVVSFVGGKATRVGLDVLRPGGPGELRPIDRRLTGYGVLQKKPVRHHQQPTGPQKVSEALVVWRLRGEPAVVVDEIVGPGEVAKQIYAFAVQGSDAVSEAEAFGLAFDPRDMLGEAVDRLDVSAIPNGVGQPERAIPQAAADLQYASHAGRSGDGDEDAHFEGA
jgi:hypothetical protein